MKQTCDHCGDEHEDGNVVFSELAYEAHEARHERRERRMLVALILAVIMLFLSNIGWIIYETQFETYRYEKGGEDLNNINYVAQGDLTYDPIFKIREKEEARGGI